MSLKKIQNEQDKSEHNQGESKHLDGFDKVHTATMLFVPVAACRYLKRI